MHFLRNVIMKIKTRNKQAMGMLPVSSCCAKRMSNPHELMKRICRASNAMGWGRMCPMGCTGWRNPMLPTPGLCTDLSLKIK